MSLNSPQGYQGEQKHHAQVYNFASQQLSSLDSKVVVHELRGLKEIENYILTGESLKRAGFDSQSTQKRRQIPMDDAQSYRNKLSLDTEAIQKIQEANLRDLAHLADPSKSPFSAKLDGTSERTPLHSHGVASEKTFDPCGLAEDEEGDSASPGVRTTKKLRIELD